MPRPSQTRGSEGTAERVRVGGIPIQVVTLAGLAGIMRDDVAAARRAIRDRSPRLVFSANGQAVSMYHRDQRFRAIMSQADVIHADGMSLVRAARLLTRTGLPERVATSDFFHYAAREAVASGISFYFLGGTEKTVRGAEERVRQLYPGLDLRGCHSGYFAEEETGRVLARVRAAEPDVVWVGLGRPKQEAFCIRHREALRGIAWLKTCGGLFAFLSGEASRAPQWVQRLGMEWAHRLMLEPNRLFWRYATTNVDAIWLMARHSGDLDFSSGGRSG